MTTKACERIWIIRLNTGLKTTHFVFVRIYVFSIVNYESGLYFSVIEDLDQNIKHLIRDSSKLYFNH